VNLFILGLFLGALLGVFTMALVQAGDDDHDD
jgi:hypothetical protein